MVKNKALPDSARLCTPHLVILSLSLSLADLALSRLVSRVFSLSLADAVHPEGIPWILPRLDPGTQECSLHHQELERSGRKARNSRDDQRSRAGTCEDRPLFVTVHLRMHFLAGRHYSHVLVC